MNRVLQLLLVQMCMVLNSFQIKSFCRVWESNYRTSLPLVASDWKTQTEAGMETTSCFPFPGRTGPDLSLSPVWMWQAPFLPGSWGNRCPNKRKQVSDCCSTPGMDQHQDSVQTVWPTQLAEELHLPLDNPWAIQLGEPIAQKDAEPLQDIFCGSDWRGACEDPGVPRAWSCYSSR